MMKTLSYCLVLLVLFFCGSQSANAQNCPNESFNFFDQIYLDQFLIDYPDCEVIKGSVTITGFINNLDALSNIRVITGDLIIEYSTELEDLTGLENLDTIYGNLIIQQSYLTSLNGIQDIKSIGEYFNITSAEYLTEIDTFNFLDTLDNLLISNTALSTLSGFSNLTYATRLSVSVNQLLTDLNSLSSLEYVEQIEISYNSQLEICNTPFICESLQNPAVSFYIQNNGDGCRNYFALLDACQETCPAGYFFSSQEELDQFVFPTSNCTKIRGDIQIQDADNSPIVNLASLSGITSIDSSLVILGNKEITSLSVFENLEYVGDDLRIQDNRLLTTLQGLENIPRVGGDVIISGNQGLERLEGLHHLSYVGNDLIISGNALDSLTGLLTIDTVERNLVVGEWSITNLTGLETLKAVNGYLFLASNQNLESLDGITSLTHIGGLNIGYNYKLLEMDALEGITSITDYISIYENQELLRMPTLPLVDSIGGFLQVYGNDKITSLQGFNSFQSIGGKLEIRDMPALTSLDGLENLAHIDGYLYFSKTGLVHLDALSSLESLNGPMTIRDNDDLENISGLDQVDPASVSTPAYFDLWISGNELLEVCNYLSVCGILQNTENIVVIEGNGDGCDSEEEVRAACVVAVHDTDADARIQVYPNPTFGTVNIEAGELSERVESMEIFDVMGVRIYKGNFQNSFVFESFNNGPYILIFRTNDNQLFRKLVVMTKE